jgi:hypothetical protein
VTVTYDFHDKTSGDGPHETARLIDAAGGEALIRQGGGCGEVKE